MFTSLLPASARKPGYAAQIAAILKELDPEPIARVLRAAGVTTDHHRTRDIRADTVVFVARAALEAVVRESDPASDGGRSRPLGRLRRTAQSFAVAMNHAGLLLLRVHLMRYALRPNQILGARSTTVIAPAHELELLAVRLRTARESLAALRQSQSAEPLETDPTQLRARMLHLAQLYTAAPRLYSYADPVPGLELFSSGLTVDVLYTIAAIDGAAALERSGSAD